MPWEIAENFSVTIGSNHLVGVPNLIVYAGESLITVERRDDGMLAVSFRVYDQNGQKILTIGRNKMFMNNKYKGNQTFSLEGGVKDWKLIEKESGDLIVGLNRLGEGEIEIYAKLYTPDGKFLINATPEQIRIGDNITLKGNLAMGSKTGINIEKDGRVGLF